MSGLTVHGGDVLEWCKSYTGEPHHAFLADPPYHLTSIHDRFSGEDAAPAKDKDGAFKRASKGFMSQEWDGGDIAFRPETWAAFKQHLYPGAFGFAFASTRGVHRMACAIEDAGFIIHPTIYLWSFGSGFPKASRIDTQIDRLLGADQVVIGEYSQQPTIEGLQMMNDARNKPSTPGQRTIPATDMAKAWAGHRYGGQALKPCVEPLVCFQKPYARGNKVEQMMKHGAGALNIHAGAVGTEITHTVAGPGKFNLVYGDMGWDGKTVGKVYHERAGRWPGNLALVCGGPDAGCIQGKGGDWIHGHACPIFRIGEQSGETETHSTGRRTPGESTRSTGVGGMFGTLGGSKSYDSESGTADRFFFCADWNWEVAERLMEADEVGYHPKPTGDERDAGLDDVVPELCKRANDSGYGQEGRPGGWSPTMRRNTHPTLKPISLNRWLASLLLPPDIYNPRRLLVPFCGSGSEMIGAALAGWECVTGIEGDPRNAAIAQARLKHWANRRVEIEGEVATLKRRTRVQSLFRDEDE